MPKGSARCRANKAYTALHHGEGVWGFGKDAEIERPKALQDAKPTKRSYRDRGQALFLKTYFFFNPNCLCIATVICFYQFELVLLVSSSAFCVPQLGTSNVSPPCFFTYSPSLCVESHVFGRLSAL